MVWRVLSGPSGTSCFSCSRYSLSLARLKEPEADQPAGQRMGAGWGRASLNQHPHETAGGALNTPARAPSCSNI